MVDRKAAARDAPAPASTTLTGPLGGALAGIRVLDLSQVLAGPFCTMLLADHGADVIKLEPPRGDSARAFPPFLPGEDGPGEAGFGGYFQSINRNKRSIVVDLKQPAGRELMLELVAICDVLVENFRAGTLEGLGLGWETLRERNPHLVYAALRGFGDPRSGQSPYNDWPAYDVVSQAMGGVMGITGPDANHPTKVGPGIGDTVPALMLAFGILAAVRHAERTGEGQFLDIAMVDGVLALCERILHQYGYAGQVAGPEGNGHPLFCPFGVFPARDGHVTLACPTDKFWQLLCTAMDRPELADHPDWATNIARNRHAAEVQALIAGWTGRHTRAELAGLLGGKVPFGPVNRVTDILADAHFHTRQMVVDVPHPPTRNPGRSDGGTDGEYFQVAGTPLKFSATPGGVRHRAPLLGEHSRQVLAEAGLSPQQIDALIGQGVVGVAQGAGSHDC